MSEFCNLGIASGFWEAFIKWNVRLASWEGLSKDQEQRGAEMEEGWLSAVLGRCILQSAVILAESGKQPIASVGMFAKSERKQSAHEDQKDPELPIIKMPWKNPERILQAPF